MADSFAGVVLAAGAGTRMHPLTIDVPKVLCPINMVPLVDHNLARLRTVSGDIAVNVSAHAGQIADHLGGRVHLSDESSGALGTAGALAKLKSWIDGRPTVVLNGDAWCPGSLDALVAGFDGERPTVLTAGPNDFGPRSGVCGAVMPWAAVEALEVAPTGLWEVSWRQALETGRLAWVNHLGPFVDCASPADYLRANLLASGGTSVVDPDGVVDGAARASVVWAGARVHAAQRIEQAIVTPRRTVLVRPLVRSWAAD